jgi:2-keto-4-pentenoate hydratase/2-oxohepta-3-ene-1,7-dioic acid hydratase in catechol pathway
LARVGAAGAEVPVVVTSDGLLDARSVTSDFHGAFFESLGPETLAAEVAEGRLPRLPDDADRRIGPPVARPGAIICIGLNYAAHAAESGAAPPTVPVMFLKTPNTVAGPYDDVRLPRRSVRTDWEVELAVVISRRASYLDSPEQSLEHVAGFVLANDLSERTFQLDESGGQWSKGKCCPGFTPLGPWLVTPDEVDHSALALRSWVNGEPRQDSSTADQIFGVCELVHHLSQYLVLDPGDIVLTGTPEGVALSGRFPYLGAGDLVELEIDGLGRQAQRMLAADAVGVAT